MTYSIDDIVLMTGAERHGFCPARISWLLTDRLLKSIMILSREREVSNYERY
jgi:hypothetical protein